ncbi:hypothetical protein ASG29_04055 [Sphingomonas sp. Leaf412]|uniref:helix-turn-helix transcriptional regulator n=1 Tax=Sphingomonas sp. Leaf412 TaxID=1736370 RepID=UPI0006F47032|nr:helix-turn-helix transcriptional regulator [Sphingomonas sp. Leaf412]KQT35283.1 hypothetical protein ASG29_04055 [Sphingomonas sp. Leaf412]
MTKSAMLRAIGGKNGMTSDDLVDNLYEAAARPSLWPTVLQDLATTFGARGALIFASEQDRAPRRMVSPGIVDFIETYEAQGWFENNVRAAPIVQPADPWFKTDTDAVSIERMRDMPVYRDLLIPAGYDAGAGTIFQGSDNDMLVVTLEGFGSHDAARRALVGLDRLRPHIGRAVSLTARIAAVRDDAILRGMEALGAAAAIVASDGSLRASTASFDDHLGHLMIEHRSRLRFTDLRLDRAFGEALAERTAPGQVARSIAVAPTASSPACVLHFLPLRRSARDLFEADGMLLLVAGANNRSLANADILRLLFDLTPAESRLARHLLEGKSLQEAATSERIKYATARVHLRSIFSKTGTHRQGELILLLSEHRDAGDIALPL